MALEWWRFGANEAGAASRIERQVRDIFSSMKPRAGGGARRRLRSGRAPRHGAQCRRPAARAVRRRLPRSRSIAGRSASARRHDLRLRRRRASLGGPAIRSRPRTDEGNRSAVRDPVAPRAAARLRPAHSRRRRQQPSRIGRRRARDHSGPATPEINPLTRNYTMPTTLGPVGLRLRFEGAGERTHPRRVHHYSARRRTARRSVCRAGGPGGVAPALAAWPHCRRSRGAGTDAAPDDWAPARSTRDRRLVPPRAALHAGDCGGDRRVGRPGLAGLEDRARWGAAMAARAPPERRGRRRAGRDRGPRRGTTSHCHPREPALGVTRPRGVRVHTTRLGPRPRDPAHRVRAPARHGARAGRRSTSGTFLCIPGVARDWRSCSASCCGMRPCCGPEPSVA